MVRYKCLTKIYSYVLSPVKISPKSLAWTQDRKRVLSKLLSSDSDLALSRLSLSKEIENGPWSRLISVEKQMEKYIQKHTIFSLP